MPQGSVLGPVLYVLYTKTIADIIKAHRVEYHFYAGDTQLYITFKCDSMEDAYLGRTRVKCCVEDINSWTIKNKLKLNGAKTELIVISSKHQPRPAIASIQVGEETINHVPTVRNLGVLLDQAYILWWSYQPIVQVLPIPSEEHWQDKEISGWGFYWNIGPCFCVI